MRYFKWIAFISLIWSLSSSFAADEFTLGTPVSGGPGCPAGSLSATLSPDKKSIQLQLQPIQVEAGGASSLQRKNCQLAVPIRVAKGYQVKLLPLSIHGTSTLPANGSLNLKFSGFFAGGANLEISKNYNGPYHQSFEITFPEEEKSLAWSSCGANTNFRFSLTTLIKSQNAKATAQVDRLGDIRFQIQACSN